MATYSNSKISTFENCRYKYKLQYIDHVEVEEGQSIEAFMGDIVHRTLEKLYKDKKFQKRIALASLLKFYKDIWEKEYSKDILIVKKDMKANNYKKMGIKFITDYFNKYKPFEEMTILGLETQDRMALPDGNQWHVRIDKLGCDDKGNYFVCDYKTNSRMKDQEGADSDRQLAMYSVWVKDKFKDAKKVILKWHMLAFNKEVISERTAEQSKKLQEDVMEIIKDVEKATKENLFPTNITKLCDWCAFKSICPAFKHEVKVETLPVEKFKKDGGVKLVDEFAEVKIKRKEFDKKEEELKEKLIEYAKQFGLEIIYGSNMKASVKEYEKFSLPEDEEQKKKFIELIKKKGLYEELSNINAMKISSLAIKGELDPELKKKLTEEEGYRVNLSKRKGGEEE